MQSDFEALQEKLGYVFQSQDLLNLAMTHKSFIYENQLQKENDSSLYNERLEYLGDSVLQLIITQYLYEKFPQDAEGVLSKKRSSLVNESQLYEIAKTLDISEIIRVGRGEKKNLGHLKPRLLASTMEALFGACFLDSNYETSRKVVLTIYKNYLDEIGNAQDYNRDYKTQFQEVVQKHFKMTPTYVITEKPNGHFHAAVCVLDKIVGVGEGPTKKQAEQSAAFATLEKLKIMDLKKIMDGSI